MPPPSTKQPASNNTRASPADRLLSSLGARAGVGDEKTSQLSVKATSLEKEPEKAPNEPVKATRPVANITGQAKTTDVSDSNTKKTTHLASKSTKPKTRSGDKPQIGAGKPDKVIAKPRKVSDTKSDRETNTWGADNVLLLASFDFLW